MRQLLRVFALLIAFIAISLFQPAANAHVSVISTSPEYQSTVDVLPEQVVIGFNSSLIVLGSEKTNTVEVINSNGESVTLGDVKVDGSTISVSLNRDQAIAGDYTVRYRVVSADGHGVSGNYLFTLAGAASATPSPMTTAPITDSEHGFWHLHRIHVIEGALALLVILGWALYRARFAPGK